MFFIFMSSIYIQYMNNFGKEIIKIMNSGPIYRLGLGLMEVLYSPLGPLEKLLSRLEQDLHATEITAENITAN